METKFSLQAQILLRDSSYRNFDRIVKLSGVVEDGEEGYVHEGRGRDVGREDEVVESAFNSRSVTLEAPRH